MACIFCKKFFILFSVVANTGRIINNCTMTRPKQPTPNETGFAQRLVEIRKRRGITQRQLAEMVNSTQRNISHYETGKGYPAVHVIPIIAMALGVTTDELFGIKGNRRKYKAPFGTAQKDCPKTNRMWKKFKKVVDLPARDQKAVIRLIDSLAKAGKG